MRGKFATALAFLTIGGLLAFAAGGPAPRAQDAGRPPDWTEASHGDDAVPDYERLFAMDRVHELRIRIAAEDFLAMQQDLATIGSAGMNQVRAARGSSSRPPPLAELAAEAREMAERLAAALGGTPDACEGHEPNAACSINGTEGQCRALPGIAQDSTLPDPELICIPGRIVFPGPGAGGPAEGFVNRVDIAGGRGGGMVPQFNVRDPIYVPVTVTYDGTTWTSVGMRFKGNSSLMSAARSSAGKIPFRLDFDRYEDEVPATRNQRFYGFQKLTFSSNYTDNSMLKEVLATEAFRDQGVPAARAAFYRIFVDAGEGDEYWGLYTMIEDPADGAMLEAQFGDDDGNLYKPEGPGANWGYFDAAGFGKKTNESEADFADVAGAVEALHAPQDDPAAWRAALESRFDVDGFLRWLAVNSLIANWDAYGRMAHNYYLYGDPEDDGRLRWIPWDHNMSFGSGFGGMPAPFAGPPGQMAFRMVGGPMSRGTGDLLHRQVDENWPLIRRILADGVYAERYRLALGEALEGMLAPETFDARVRELHAMVAPFVVGPNGERSTHTTLNSPADFENADDALIGLMTAQREAARTALAAPR
jgi:hypothetical protein